MTINPYVYPILKHDLLCLKKHPYIKNYSRLKTETVVETIAKEFELSDDFINVKTRKRIYADPKKLLCHILVKHMHMGTVEASRQLNGYDHSVVTYSCKAYANLYSSNKTFKDRCDSVLRKLYLI